MLVWLQNPFDNLPTEGYRKQRYWLMAEAFVRAGHRVILWTSDFNHTTKGRRVEVAKLGGGDIQVRMIPTLPYRRNVSWARVKSHRAYAKAWEALARQETTRPDLIVTSFPTIGGAEAALRVGRHFGARVVVDVQDAWPETFARLAPRGLRALAHLALTGLRRRSRRVFREADQVSGVCERYRELTGRADYHRAYLGVERIIGPEAWTRLSQSRQKEDDASSPARLIYAGNLGVSYDLGTVIRGLGKARLDIAGKGECEDKWKALVSDLGLEAQVTFHGYLDESSLRRLMSACAIGIVPMQDCSFVGVPNKFCEYAAAGLRIVSSLGGESADLLRRYGCGETYASGDAASFSAAVARAQELPPASALELAKTEFDATRIYDCYVSRCAQRF